VNLMFLTFQQKTADSLRCLFYVWHAFRMKASMSAAANSLPVYAQVELRTVFCFLHEKGETPISIHRRLCETFGALQNRKLGIMTKGVWLFHDNARFHITSNTKALLDQFCWDVISYHPTAQNMLHLSITYSWT